MMVLIETRSGERLGVVADEDAAHALHPLLPAGYTRRLCETVRGADSLLYQVADASPLRELTAEDLGGKAARVAAALAKLTEEEKDALGLTDHNTDAERTKG